MLFDEMFLPDVTWILIIVIGVFFYRGVKIVPQSDVWVVERLGRFNRTIDGGLHLIIPFVDSLRAKLTTREQIIDIQRQSVITKDNVNITVDGIVFVKVQDAKSATYNITDFKNALSNLAMTTLRSEIGQLALDETLSSRSSLNAKILTELDEASGEWGIKTMRVEISEISVPREIEEAMNLQMKAEREKRAIELRASADKEATIREAEGFKAKEVLTAEAIERMADAKKYELERIAEAQKESIRLINESISENPQSAEYLLAQERIKAFKELASSDSKDKVIVPYEATELIGSLSLIAEGLKGVKPVDLIDERR
jgi:regulator of protease activity HflC (stomatin/prohibitin superfamily)